MERYDTIVKCNLHIDQGGAEDYPDSLLLVSGAVNPREEMDIDLTCDMCFINYYYEAQDIEEIGKVSSVGDILKLVKTSDKISADRYDMVKAAIKKHTRNGKLYAGAGEDFIINANTLEAIGWEELDESKKVEAVAKEFEAVRFSDEIFIDTDKITFAVDYVDVWSGMFTDLHLPSDSVAAIWVDITPIEINSQEYDYDVEVTVIDDEYGREGTYKITDWDTKFYLVQRANHACEKYLRESIVTLYNNRIKNKKEEDMNNDMIAVNEALYEKICRAYVDSMLPEFVFVNPENNNSIVHGYFRDDDVAEEVRKKGIVIGPDNYRDYASEVLGNPWAEEGSSDDSYEYDSWEDFFEEYVKDETYYDLQDGVYWDAYGNWDYEITPEEFEAVGIDMSDYE